MKPRQFTNGNIDTQLKMISSRKKTKQNQIHFFLLGASPKFMEPRIQMNRWLPNCNSVNKVQMQGDEKM